MYCHKCGTKIHEESLFCMKCGTKLKLLEVENSDGITVEYDMKDDSDQLDNFDQVDDSYKVDFVASVCTTTESSYKLYFNYIKSKLYLHKKILLVVVVFLFFLINSSLNNNEATKEVTSTENTYTFYSNEQIILQIKPSLREYIRVKNNTLYFTVEDINQDNSISIEESITGSYLWAVGVDMIAINNSLEIGLLEDRAGNPYIGSLTSFEATAEENYDFYDIDGELFNIPIELQDLIRLHDRVLYITDDSNIPYESDGSGTIMPNEYEGTISVAWVNYLAIKKDFPISVFRDNLGKINVVIDNSQLEEMSDTDDETENTTIIYDEVETEGMSVIISPDLENYVKIYGDIVVITKNKNFEESYSGDGIILYGGDYEWIELYDFDLIKVDRTMVIDILWDYTEQSIMIKPQ